MSLKGLVKKLPPFRRLVEERDSVMVRLEAMERRAARAEERVRDLEQAEAASCYDHDGMKLYEKTLRS
jgi:hypothetical protein